MVFSPRFVQRIVGCVFPVLRKTQKVNLGLAVFGQVKSQSTILSEIVRQIPGAVKHKHRLKRLWRFVSNSLVKPERLFEFWVPWVIHKFCSQKRILVALDWTGISGNNMCLVASLVLYGRAIPLIWQLVKFSDIKDSTNRIEQRLVTRLINLFSIKKQLILVADRGFGRTEFLQFLLEKQIKFVIRVRSEVRIKPVKHKAFLLTTLTRKLISETPIWYPSVLYRNDGAISGISLAAVVAKDSNDPWFLATNLKSAQTAISVYSQRFQIEEGFKDFKYALGFEKIQTRDLKRIRRLILISAVSQAILMLVGRLAFRMVKLKSTLITGGKQVCSRIWLATQIIKRELLGQSFWIKVRAKALSP